jgi:glycosyltransferase involved in cell wall biosynthesis
MRLQGQALTDEEGEQRIAQEIKLADGCWSVISVSDSEGAQFAQRGISRVHTLGHATTLSPTRNAFAQRRTVLFVGALPDAACPNGEGLVWFCSEVLPLLQRRLNSEVKLIVAGSNRLERHGSLANDSVVFAGTVEDLTPLYDSARLFVAPIRFAAGIPVKIIEAAAHGVPVVTTPLLAAQLGWKHEAELLVAQSAEEFAGECARLYEDESLWESVRLCALNRARTEFSIEHFSMKLKSIVEAATGPLTETQVPSHVRS